MTTLADRLEQATIVICVGAGGVGKTTISAGLALALAARGRRVAVVTIDPARRLADALGLDALENRPTRVDPALLAAAGIELRGELWAMMLDAKRTFDELVAEVAPDARTRDEILANRIYGQVSTAIGGSQEYTAMAKLYDLARDAAFDVIVLDTAPSRNAMDFLEAPERLLGLLDGRAVQALLAPGGLTARVTQAGTGVAVGLLRRLTGVDLLADLRGFLRAMGGVMGPFGDRARGVRELLGAPGTRCVLVTAPTAMAEGETGFLAERLERAGLHVAGVVANRVHPVAPGDSDPASVERRLAATLGPALAARVAGRHDQLQRLARRDAECVGRLRARMPALPVAIVADAAEDVHDVRALAQVAGQLLGGAALDEATAAPG